MGHKMARWPARRLQLAVLVAVAAVSGGVYALVRTSGSVTPTTSRALRIIVTNVHFSAPPQAIPAAAQELVKIDGVVRNETDQAYGITISCVLRDANGTVISTDVSDSKSSRSPIDRLEPRETREFRTVVRYAGLPVSASCRVQVGPRLTPPPPIALPPAFFAAPDLSRLAVGSGSLWSMQRAKHPEDGFTLLRIDAHSGKLRARIPIGLVPGSIAYGEGALWVTNASGAGVAYPCHAGLSCPKPQFPRENSVMRIDPTTNQVVASIPIPNPTGVAVGEGAVWVTDPEGRLHRIDPRTNRVVETVAVERPGRVLGGAEHLTAGYGAVWVALDTVSSGTGPSHAELLRIDARTNSVVAKFPLGATSAHDVVVADGAVWVATSPDFASGKIVRIDSVTNQITPVDFSLAVNELEADESGVWFLQLDEEGLLSHLDQGTLHRSDPLKLGPSAGSLALGEGAIWVLGDGRIIRIAP